MVDFNTPLKAFLVDNNYHHQQTAQTINASGESYGVVFNAWWKGGSPGQTKTISNLGGQISIYLASIVFANVGSTFRVGIQGVNAAGMEDGVWATYTEFVGGGGGLANNQLNTIAMANGSITVSYGQQLALVAEMPARAGADQFLVLMITSNKAFGNSTGGCTYSMPYGTRDFGLGVQFADGLMKAHIVYDDGTIGSYGPGLNAFTATGGVTTNSVTNTTARGYTFIPPLSLKLEGVSFIITSAVTTPGFKVEIREDPYGTNTLLNTYTIPYNSIAVNSNGEALVRFNDHPVFSSGTEYAILIYPDYVGSFDISVTTVISALFSHYVDHSIFGQSLKSVSYSIAGGTYTNVTNQMPNGLLQIAGLETAGSAGRSLAYGF